jgi:iron complex transport system ATP-binding protein
VSSANGRPAGGELRAEGLSLDYGAEEVVHAVDLVIPQGRITAIIGANASGKSTLLRGLARLLKPRSGAAYLDGRRIHQMNTLELARRLGLLPQEPISPDGITVRDLVGRGRYPHQGWFRQWTRADEVAVSRAVDETGIADLADRRVQELSGGQRQRVWVAMALAQETDLLLLDEPTTFLDINHQIELLDLLVRLNREGGKTIVIVLHDLNLACRYADRVVALKSGRIAAEGAPREVVDAALVEEVFGVPCEVISDPVSGAPLVIPHSERDWVEAR